MLFTLFIGKEKHFEVVYERNFFENYHDIATTGKFLEKQNFCKLWNHFCKTNLLSTFLNKFLENGSIICTSFAFPKFSLSLQCRGRVFDNQTFSRTLL